MLYTKVTEKHLCKSGSLPSSGQIPRLRKQVQDNASQWSLDMELVGRSPVLTGQHWATPMLIGHLSLQMEEFSYSVPKAELD